MLTDAELKKIRPLRYTQQIAVGEGLYLVVTPRHGRYWRFNYSFGGRRRTFHIGLFYDIPFKKAKAHHQFARMLLEAGFDPALLKATLGKHAFGVAAREWQIDMASKEAKSSSKLAPGLIDE